MVNFIGHCLDIRTSTVHHKSWSPAPLQDSRPCECLAVGWRCRIRNAACQKATVTCKITETPDGFNVQLWQAKRGFSGKQIKIRNRGIDVWVICGWMNEGMTEREWLSSSQDDVNSRLGEHGAAHVSDLQRERDVFKGLLHLTWYTHTHIWIKIGHNG